MNLYMSLYKKEVLEYCYSAAEKLGIKLTGERLYILVALYKTLYDDDIMCNSPLWHLLDYIIETNTRNFVELIQTQNNNENK